VLLLEPLDNFTTLKVLVQSYLSLFSLPSVLFMTGRTF